MLKKLWHKLALAAVASSVIIGTAAAQASETFFVQEGKALNTNNLFGKIDGQPRMSIWQRNDSDSDQQFDRLPGNRGGILLKHRSTGKCLNAARLWNGAEMNVWNCDANDSDQNWNLVDVGNGFNLIKRTGTNLCVDTPTRNDGGIVHLWDCDSNNGNQRWKSSVWGSPTSPPPTAPTWKLPWSKSVTAKVTQGWHPDGYGLSSIDFGLSPGQPVLAPFDSKVISQCNAGNNHRAIKLQASNGQFYSLIHVNTANISTGQTYKQGEKIGVVASDTPWNKCAQSTGPHLHMGFPSNPFTIDGYTFGSSIPTGYLRSTEPN